uniref:Uncharacterized protein n=1 Tax=Gossypium raimondii TaxID=29730 RepID=A0A0D2TJS8_GOSRA|nr:hypothetical protein B456_009G051400 [Gossypium raimondii]
MRRSVEGWTTSFAASTSFTVPFSFKRSVRLPCLQWGTGSGVYGMLVRTCGIIKAKHNMMKLRKKRYGSDGKQHLQVRGKQPFLSTYYFFYNNKIGKGPKLLIPKGTTKTNVIVTLFQVKKGETKSYFV